MRRTALMIFALLGLFGTWPAPAEAQLTGCFLTGPYAWSAFLTTGNDAQVSGVLTFTPGSCSPGVPGTVKLDLAVLPAGSPAPLPLSTTLPYTVDPTSGGVDIGPGLIHGMLGQLSDVRIANSIALEADPAISPASVRFAGTALRLVTTSSFGSNTVVGRFALDPSTGDGNTATGSFALSANTTGGNNTATGGVALTANTTGSSNTAVGAGALGFNTTGSGNVAIGDNAGTNVITGGNNIYIGTSGAADESNVIRIGSSVSGGSTFIAGIAGNPIVGDIVAVSPSGQLGTAILVPSSERFKEDVQDMGEASAGLLRLRPVTFRYKPEHDDGTHRVRYGLIAEEAAEVFPTLVQYTAAGEPQTVRYLELPAMLLNELQKLHRTIQTEEQRIAALEAQLAELLGRLARLEPRTPLPTAE